MTQKLILFLFVAVLSGSTLQAQDSFDAASVKKNLESDLELYKKSVSDSDQKAAFRKVVANFDDLVITYPNQEAQLIALARESIENIGVDFDLLYYKGQVSIVKIPKLSTSLAAVDKVLSMPAEMPVYPDCKEVENKFERLSCTETAVMKFFEDNLSYLNPPSGYAVLEMVINQKGKVVEAKILRSLEAGFDKEILRVAHLMNAIPGSWEPGKVKGEKVDVRYNIPVRFE